MTDKDNPFKDTPPKPKAKPQKERPGSAPGQPSNADYDYGADFGTSDGAADHKPELGVQPVPKPPLKKNGK